MVEEMESSETPQVLRLMLPETSMWQTEKIIASRSLIALETSSQHWGRMVRGMESSETPQVLRLMLPETSM